MVRISECGCHRWAQGVFLAILMGVPSLSAWADAYTEHAPPEAIAAATRRALADYAHTRRRFLEATNDPVLAWTFARACFDCADRASNNVQRASFSQEGITAAERALTINPKLGPAWFYLGLNQGQLARTRKLTALGLLGDIENSWTKAIQFEAAFDFAGPHRSLGVLYRDAPGWPLSLGNRSKARRHLEKAAQIAPDYPENELCLLESYLEWGDKAAAKARLPAARKAMETSRTQLTGPAWEVSWHDWNHRLEVVKQKLER